MVITWDIINHYSNKGHIIIWESLRSIITWYANYQKKFTCVKKMIFENLELLQKYCKLKWTKSTICFTNISAIHFTTWCIDLQKNWSITAVLFSMGYVIINVWR